MLKIKITFFKLKTQHPTNPIEFVVIVRCRRMLMVIQIKIINHFQSTNDQTLTTMTANRRGELDSAQPAGKETTISDRVVKLSRSIGL